MKNGPSGCRSLVGSAHQNTRHHKRLTDIHSGNPLDDRIHHCLLRGEAIAAPQVTPDTAMHPSRNPGSTNGGTFGRRRSVCKTGSAATASIHDLGRSPHHERSFCHTPPPPPSPLVATTQFSSPVVRPERTARVCKMTRVNPAARLPGAGVRPIARGGPSARRSSEATGPSRRNWRLTRGCAGRSSAACAHARGTWPRSARLAAL